MGTAIPERRFMTDREKIIARMAADIVNMRAQGHTASFACLRTRGWTAEQILDHQVLALDRALKAPLRPQAAAGASRSAPAQPREARGGGKVDGKGGVNPILQVAKTVAGFAGDAAEAGAIALFACGVLAFAIALADSAGRLA